MTVEQIEHFVVLMLENHSYDHLLGFVSGDLTGTESQPETCSPDSTRHLVTDDAPDSTTSPGHSIGDVNRQLYCTLDPASGAAATMEGFLADFALQSPPSPNPLDAIRCFGSKSPDQPLALWSLAAHFSSADRWFSSVPGPTSPNRLFANCASSMGYAGPLYENGTLPESLSSLPSVFDLLNGVGKTWNAFHEDDTFVTEGVLTRALPGLVCDPGFTTFTGLAHQGSLPNYSFLTPSLWHDSQHPPASVIVGDQLVAKIYTALFGIPGTRPPLWDRTALLVTYDEHGGYYDHVPPPANQPYDGLTWGSESPTDFDYDSSQPAFDFSRWGLRVPAVLVSAYTPPGVDSTVYEHSSIVHTVRDLFSIPTALTQRDENAASLVSRFPLDAARSDMPDLSELTGSQLPG